MGKRLLVSAAASLINVFTEIGEAFAGMPEAIQPRFQFAASGVLKQQILAGAPVDVFAAASEEEVNALVAAKRIIPETRTIFATNHLVVIARADSRLTRFDRAMLAKIRRFAIGNPETVPAGRYAREMLTRRGDWETLRPRLVYGENVRQTLTYVLTGNVDAGIVFASDGKTTRQNVRILATSHSGSDPIPIRYPAAIIAGSPNIVLARKFVTFLTSPAAPTLLQKSGFGLP